jgi:hypothetical protein
MDNIIKMPATEPQLSDQDIVNLFMGLVRLMRRQYQSQIDNLNERIASLVLQIG